MRATSTALCSLLLLFTPIEPARSQATTVRPILEFPEAGMDDRAAYQGYQTRFFRDTRGNVVQVYLDARSGRVVNLLADALDESVGFTVRDSSGKPVPVSWASRTALISSSGPRRTIEYRLQAEKPVRIGLLLLNSMRVERDLGYSGRQVAPFELPTFRLPEQELLIANIERLPPPERQRQLAMLRARDASELRSRLTHTVAPITPADPENGTNLRGIRASQTSLDGKTNLGLEITVDPRQAVLTIAPAWVAIRPRNAGPIDFTVRISTDGPSLTPLSRAQIFNPSFLSFLESERTKAARSANTPAGLALGYRYRQLERDVRGTELLSSREKLMAGLPNYATYFGRDMMMTSLMMEPVWQPSMLEHVIASALNKLGPNGDVSHEEALGGQAIRENASEYNGHIAEFVRLRRTGNPAAADTALANARALLVNLQQVRENYHMRDDEFQLPIIVARYLANPAISSSQKRAFLMDASGGRGTRVSLLMRELGLVATLAAPYARNPVTQNLLGSPRLDSTHWRSVSWRDSNAGYGNGRFAMDINAIWVPRALEATADILASLRQLNLPADQFISTAGSGQTALANFARDNAFLRRAIDTWQGAVEHFIVRLSGEDVRAGVDRKLRTLLAGEREYWQNVLAASRASDSALEFVALSLDETGKPVQVVNTDPATWIFLQDNASTSASSRERALRDVRTFVREYPVALFVDRLGPVVANDAYASPMVQAAFEKDLYHSPRVVWGREVNLIMLGLSKQILAATNSAGQPRSEELRGYVAELKNALERVNTAVEASGLKHNELWSYEINGARLAPIRYGASTDVQLWNVTDLAVQYVLARLKR